MTTVDLAGELIGNVRTYTNDVLDDLSAEALTWRVDPTANTIAWLIWHLARVQDDHVADLAGSEQVWSAEWAARFGLDPDDTRIGYGDTPEQVQSVRPDSAADLRDYLAAVTDRTLEFLTDGAPHDWDRIVDDDWDPPVTARVRLASVITDTLQHLGQAAYVRGVYERVS